MFLEICCPDGLKPTSKTNLGLGSVLLTVWLFRGGGSSGRWRLDKWLVVPCHAEWSSRWEGTELSSSLGFHVYSCPGLVYVRSYSNY